MKTSISFLTQGWLIPNCHYNSSMTQGRHLGGAGGSMDCEMKFFSTTMKAENGQPTVKKAQKPHFSKASPQASLGELTALHGLLRRVVFAALAHHSSQLLRPQTSALHSSFVSQSRLVRPPITDWNGASATTFSVILQTLGQTEKEETGKDITHFCGGVH